MSGGEASQVPIGTILEGKFRVTQEIGRGGMAAVYEAENVDIGKRVAVKILSAELLTSRVVRERFIREARAAAAIHSPYICEVYDSGMFQERPFLVMELLEGESLYDRMTRVRQLRVSTTLKIIRHVGRGLAKAHEAGVVHRDLKPENIFLTRDAEGQLLAKIVDFGLAKFYEGRDGSADKNVRLTREGALFGTPAYMSPEQAKGQGEVDHRADLWALGCIVYECLTGQTVWDVGQGVAMILAQIARGQLPNPRDQRPDLPESFTQWFGKALHPDLTQRYQSTRDFLTTLEAALEGTSNSTSQPSYEHVSLPSVEYEPLPLPKPAPPSAPTLPNKDSGRAIAWLLTGATLVLSVYAFWIFSAERDTTSKDQEPTLGTLAREHTSPLLEPAEKGPGAAAIAKAQGLLQDDQPREALALLEQARGERPTVAGGLIAHAEVSVDAKGPCQLAGLGRPRPFDVVAPAANPRLLIGKAGLLLAWSDAHQDPQKRSIYTTLLDDALRRSGPVRNVSPEARMAIFPLLARLPNGVAAFYWDSQGTEAGIYGREIESDGRIRSAIRLLSEQKRDKYFPTLAEDPGRGFWVLWSEAGADGSRDIVGLPVDLALNRTGPPRALTAHRTGDATDPAAVILEGRLYFTYQLRQRSGATKILLVRLRLDDPALSNGIDAQADKTLGEALVVREGHRQAEPALSCDEGGCFVVWDDETAGAFAAYAPHDQSTALWHSEFASKGKRPTIARSTSGETAIAYYANDRVLIQLADKNGLQGSSVISKVSGFQPSPHLIAGSMPGEWLMAWRDYEAGHLELFVARAQCKASRH